MVARHRRALARARPRDPGEAEVENYGLVAAPLVPTRCANRHALCASTVWLFSLSFVLILERYVSIAFTLQLGDLVRVLPEADAVERFPLAGAEGRQAAGEAGAAAAAAGVMQLPARAARDHPAARAVRVAVRRTWREAADRFASRAGANQPPR